MAGCSPHADTVRSVSFLADGRLLASKGRDGSVRLWDCGAWTPAGVIAEPGKGAWSPRLAFHPGRPLLARAGSDDGVDDDAVVHLWHLDPDRLLGQSGRRASPTPRRRSCWSANPVWARLGSVTGSPMAPTRPAPPARSSPSDGHQRPPRHCASRPAIMPDHARDASTQDQTRLSGIASTRHRHPGLPAPAAP
jgi:WD40 repeat protein